MRIKRCNCCHLIHLFLKAGSYTAQPLLRIISNAISFLLFLHPLERSSSHCSPPPLSRSCIPSKDPPPTALRRPSPAPASPRKILLPLLSAAPLPLGREADKEQEERMESSFSDETLFWTALVTLHVMCPLTVLSLRFLVAPYGRHARPGWGPAIPAALAWALMESPTLWLTLLLLPRGRHRSHPFALAILALYLLHYVHRTLIYPLRLSIQFKSKSKSGFPLVIAFFAFSFNLLNAYLQARSASHYAEYPDAFGWWMWLRVLAGMGIFFWGMAVNIRSDLVLVRLKAEGGGYKIPRGGWFEWVSCPNYMGEAAEWLGWAVVACSPAALAFFLYTCSNLVPRARAHHQWYREKFGEDYPKSRKAVVPLVY